MFYYSAKSPVLRVMVMTTTQPSQAQDAGQDFGIAPLKTNVNIEGLVIYSQVKSVFQGFGIYAVRLK